MPLAHRPMWHKCSHVTSSQARPMNTAGQLQSQMSQPASKRFEKNYVNLVQALQNYDYFPAKLDFGLRRRINGPLSRNPTPNAGVLVDLVLRAFCITPGLLNLSVQLYKINCIVYTEGIHRRAKE